MTYILSKDLPDRESLIYEKGRMQQWRAYEQRLQKIAKRLPDPAREYALAGWHYDPQDHRCPYGAWLEHVTVRELASGERSEHRSLEIYVRLLGSYHDGYIEFLYTGVESYCLDQPYRSGQWDSTDKGHKDWLIDEVDLSQHGHVLHEIEWADRGHWLIECASLSYRWIVKEGQPFVPDDNI